MKTLTKKQLLERIAGPAPKCFETRYQAWRAAMQRLGRWKYRTHVMSTEERREKNRARMKAYREAVKK